MWLRVVQGPRKYIYIYLHVFYTNLIRFVELRVRRGASLILVLLLSVIVIIFALHLYEYDFINCYEKNIEEINLALSTLVPIRVYKNAEDQKGEVLKENRGKCGIYQ